MSLGSRATPSFPPPKTMPSDGNSSSSSLVVSQSSSSSSLSSASSASSSSSPPASVASQGPVNKDPGAVAKKPFDPLRALYKYVLSCAAATVAESATYPLDMTKTRLQIQGAALQAIRHHSQYGLNVSKEAIIPHRGMFGTAMGIIRHEGVLRLWVGLTPAVLRHYIYTGIRVNVYEQLREHVFRRNKDGTYTLWKALLSGALGGAVAQLCASPADLLKVRLQTEGLRTAQGLPPRHTGLVDAVRSTVAEGGLRALWKGWVPNCQRAALVNMADLATYDTAKRQLLKRTRLNDNWMCHALASSVSGLAAATMSTPADVVKTRVMNQPTDPATGRGLLYRSSLDCLAQTVRQEGPFALYKGFVPIWARMAPWSLTFWVSYEEIRRFAGASSF